MTNDFADNFLVFVGANKNFVNQWSCPTLEQAEKSITLFKLENPKKDRNFAMIMSKIDKRRIKEIKL